MPSQLKKDTSDGSVLEFVWFLLASSPKNQTPSSGSMEIFLPLISSISSETSDRVWCPVRTLKWYLDRMKEIRSSSSLFITSVSPHKPASKATISAWLVQCIKAAGDEALLSTRVRAHDTRAIGTSWALFHGASFPEIQKAAFWSNPNSFFSCYLKDVIAAEARFASAVLKTATLIPCTCHKGSAVSQ